MSDITSASSAATANAAITPGQAPLGPSSYVPLLPPPETSDIDGAIAALMKLSSETNSVQTKSAMANIERMKNLKKALADRRYEALDRAIKAAAEAAKKKEEDDGGFFGSIIKDIVDNIGPVALVGFAVGGVFMVAADYLAHKTGLEDNKLDLADAGALACMVAGPIGYAVYAAEQCTKKFGPDDIQEALDQGPSIDDDEVRQANRLALMLAQAQLAIAATVATGGTATPAVIACVGVGISTAGQVLQETGALKAMFGEDAAYVGMGISITGAALTLGGSVYSVAQGAQGGLKAASATEKALLTSAKAAETGVGTVNAVHNIEQGFDALEAADLEHEADNARIEARKYRQIIAFIDRVIDDVIDDVRQIQESAQKTGEVVKAIVDTRSQTLLISAGAMRA